ncbi:unnamed protein product [Thelazia callipaeda]|uniref:ANK_REP_REGION domain-containing protein n=1 Tax=Thelazia callipaeda TaxID=103827 RepID=A0A0N5CVF6_THECL|nr:unnamed protein product [Thelazia callipaeda]
MGRCQYAIDSLPAFTPQLIAFLLAVLEFVVVLFAYISRETYRKKTFYGREDFEDIPEDEKMDHEGAIMGKNNEELRIVQSADRSVEMDAGTVTAPTASGVKVMVRRRKARNAISLSHFNYARNTGHGEPQATRMMSDAEDNTAIHFTLDVDRTARGFEFIHVLQKSIKEVEEFKNIKSKLSDDAADRLCEFVIHKMRTVLEESTQRKWIVHAAIQNKRWKVSGLENLLEKGGDIRMQQMLRVTTQGPMAPIIILAYMVVDVSAAQVVRPYGTSSLAPFAMVSRRSRSKIPLESATQSVSRYFFYTQHTMSSNPSEKLLDVVDSRARSRGSKKKDMARGSSTSGKFAHTVPRSAVYSNSRQKKKSTPYEPKKGYNLRNVAPTRRAFLIDTETRSRFPSFHNTEKLPIDSTQSE